MPNPPDICLIPFFMLSLSVYAAAREVVTISFISEMTMTATTTTTTICPYHHIHNPQTVSLSPTRTAMRQDQATIEGFEWLYLS